jgi:hypothetical protein
MTEAVTQVRYDLSALRREDVQSYAEINVQFLNQSGEIVKALGEEMIALEIGSLVAEYQKKLHDSSCVRQLSFYSPPKGFSYHMCQDKDSWFSVANHEWEGTNYTISFAPGVTFVPSKLNGKNLDPIGKPVKLWLNPNWSVETRYDDLQIATRALAGSYFSSIVIGCAALLLLSGLTAIGIKQYWR